MIVSNQLSNKNTGWKKIATDAEDEDNLVEATDDDIVLGEENWGNAIDNEDDDTLEN